METKVSQETDLYSTKFYTSGISRHLGATPQHSTVTNGQTLEPAEGRGGRGRRDMGRLWIEASQGPQPRAGEVEKLQLRCAKINQK